MKTAFPYRYILALPTFEYDCLVWLNIKERARQRQGALISNHCLLSQNQLEEGDFSVENLGLFFQSSGNIKQEIITIKWTHKLPHKLPNNLGFMVVGNEELLSKALLI